MYKIVTYTKTSSICIGIFWQSDRLTWKNPVPKNCTINVTRPFLLINVQQNYAGMDNEEYGWEHELAVVIAVLAFQFVEHWLEGKVCLTLTPIFLFHTFATLSVCRALGPVENELIWPSNLNLYWSSWNERHWRQIDSTANLPGSQLFPPSCRRECW